MLVDNGVEGDSRVQKQARSAAARGWDVTLLGVSPTAEVQSWTIGDATVRLVPLPSPLARRRHEYRRAPLRDPLAYPPGPLADYRLQLMRVRTAEVAAQRTAARRARTSGPRRKVTLAALKARALQLDSEQRWVELRAEHSRDLSARRRAMDGRLDQLTTKAWTTLLGERAWRRLEPALFDFELAFGPVLDELRPDLVHANDDRMLGVGARAVARARAAGRTASLVWDSHEFLPGKHVYQAHPRWLPARMAHEAEYAGAADAVVTVSEMMVELLVDTYHLTTTPVIVRNAPTVGLDAPPDPEPGIRELCGLADDVPLVVYAGAVAPQRGIDVMVEALAQLPDVHVALLARPSRWVNDLKRQAKALGAADRFHVHPYVPVDRICRHLASADVGVTPSLHYLNHEVDLPTKYYEFVQARLPLVVSDLTTTSETTRRLGNGEVFVAGDADDYARALRLVLADPQRYRAAYDTHAELLASWMWEPQADVLDAVYASLVPSAT